MISIPKNFYNEMVAQAQAEHPNECCGLLTGKQRAVTKLYRMTNTHHSPVSYFMEPKEQFAVFKEMREQETELLVIYHSHPHTVAYPSKTDVGLAHYPEALYIIISLENQQSPVVKGYRIVDGGITPEDFMLT